MNPWAFITIAVGILLIIIGVKGTQHNITGAIVGHSTGGGISGLSVKASSPTAPSTRGHGPGHPLPAPGT